MLDVITLGLPKLSLGRNILSNLEDALTREWIVTNGLGGYASSTVLGVNTRKYHGLLVASFNPPINRWVTLSKLDETVQIGDKTYDFGANEFHGIMHPKGYLFLSDFSVAPFPTFSYFVQGVSLQKTIFMPYQKNATTIIYKVTNPTDQKVSVFVSPLVNSRHIYQITDKNKIDWNFIQNKNENTVTIQPSNSVSSLILSSSKGSFVEEYWWIEKLFYRVDSSRNESSTEDNYRPGFFQFVVEPNQTKHFHILAVAAETTEQAKSLFSSFGKKNGDIDLLYRQELNRHKGLLNIFQNHNSSLEQKEWLNWIVQAADSFIVERASTQTKSVIAGYPWFEDWGRDALISLPGLTLVTGKFDDAREILLTFGHYCRDGIVPNRFSDKAGDIPLYNTVDATLWFFNAVLQYLKYTGDYEFIKKNLWSTLTNIIENHVNGTIYGIHLDTDGLLAHGSQLTWMDAATVDGFVTPRKGKAVEIQALWYNALKTMQLLASWFNQEEKRKNYSNMAQNTKISFEEKFWNKKGEYLFDVITEDNADSSLRPNQLIAVSLDFPVLESSKRLRVVDVVWKRLWGTFGLKTLPETDSRYHGVYLGDWSHRDNAYHNGTVWPWLLGPFVTAFTKTRDHQAPWRRFALKNFLEPLFQDHLYHAGLGTISEIFDGNEPHKPRGCISQAWSVAEPLRAYVEDIEFIRPKHEKEVLGMLVIGK
ncbi:MAG: amylo-alpha-1,6-glucosidase [Candidatus Bathyarchaeota archaeon]|nr:amylo-alpha-1,6-glucosidase [Candidatus Bathyarchaeum tardum]